jgi:hypothetical protein
MRISALSFHPLHRPSWRSGGATAHERWSWDFVADGTRLSTVFSGDRMAALGAGTPAWNQQVAEKLLGHSDPDLPPNRVALYVCPECFDLGCGAITAALERTPDRVTWSDFRLENDLRDLVDPRKFAIGPFTFDRAAYEAAIRAASVTPVGPSAVPLLAS